MYLLLTFNVFCTFFTVSIVDFEQVNVSWVMANIPIIWKLIDLIIFYEIGIVAHVYPYNA